MKKHKLVYRLCRYEGEVIRAQREAPFEMQLFSRMILDNLCFTWNKKQLEMQIDEAIDLGQKERFIELSELYMEYVWK